MTDFRDCNENGIFDEKLRELKEWSEASGIKPEVFNAIVAQSPSLDIARGKLEQIIAAGQESAFDKDAADLVQLAEAQGIKRDDAWAIVKNSPTLKAAEEALNELLRENPYTNAVKELRLWAEEQGIKDEEVTEALKNTHTIDEARGVLESRLSYRKRMNELVNKISAECGLPREYVLQILGKAKGNIQVLELLADELFRKSHDALEFKKEFKFDSILDAIEEIDRCGGCIKAAEIWKTAALLRKEIPEYARKSMADCVTFTLKESPEVVHTMINEYKCGETTRKSKSRWRWLLLLIVIIVGVVYYISSKSPFTIEVLSGNGAELESVVFNTFGKGFTYQNNTYTISATGSKKLQFIEELKAQGHTVTALSPDKYSISLKLSADSRENWKVDSSAFRSDAAALGLFRSCLGSTVSGGTADVVSLTREQLNQAQQTLDAQGYAVVSADGLISIKIKTLTCQIQAAPEVAAAVGEILRAFNIRAAGEVVMTENTCRSLLAALQNDARLGKVECVGNVINISAPARNLYKVAVQLDSPQEYQAAIKALSEVTEIRIDAKKLVNHGNIMTIGEFKVSSMIRSSAQIKEAVCGALSGKLKNFRDRNVKVSK